MISETGYVCLDYRVTLMEMDEKYENDIDLALDNEHKEQLEIELDNLKEKGFIICDTDFTYGCIVIKVEKNIDVNVPYVSIEPEVNQSSPKGYACEWCTNWCDNFNRCEIRYSYMISEPEPFNETKFKYDYIKSLPENNILKQLYFPK